MSKPRVVVVGGGVAGTYFAREVAKLPVELTVVSDRDYFEILWASVRAVVDPTVADKSIFPLASIPGGLGTLKVGRVTSVTSTAVTLASGEVLPYDYLCIATGSKFTSSGAVTPGAEAATSSSRREELKAMAEKIRAAKNIVIAGGGPVGVEVAGEIFEAYAGKVVTVVESNDQLLAGKDKRLHDYCKLFIEKNGGQVVLQDRVESWDQAGRTVTTKQGKSLPADLLIWAAGATPNTGILKGGDLEGALNERGYIKVDPHLRVEGHPNIFALGDVNNTPQIKLGYLANMQGQLSAKNLKALLAGSNNLSAWSPPLQPAGAMIVSLGKKDGVGHVGTSCVCAGKGLFAGLPARMKSGTLFVDKTRAELGLK